MALHYDLDDIGGEQLVELTEGNTPADRRFIAETSLTCSGLAADQSACVIDALVARHPDVFERDGGINDYEDEVVDSIDGCA